MREVDFESPYGMSVVMAELNIGSMQLAAVLDVSTQTIKRMLTGDREIGPQVARLLRAMYVGEYRPTFPKPMSAKIFALNLEFLEITDEEFADLMSVDEDLVAMWKTVGPNKFAATAIRWLRDGWEPPELVDPELSKGDAEA